MHLAAWRQGSHFIAAGLVALGLSGCGTEDFSDQVPAADATPINFGLSGSVGDGPVVNATVMLQDSEGNVLLSDVSDEQANYRLNGRVKRQDYPLIVAVNDGTDLVTGARPDFGLAAVVYQEGGSRTANLNPQGTLIRNIAERLPGGLIRDNVEQAKQIVLDQLSFGLDTGKVADPVSTKIGADNVTTIVRASEALGEMTRRVRDRMLMTGSSVTANEVVDLLAADLTDGKIDGVGAGPVDPRVAALSTLVSAQIIYEVSQNRLKVDGYRATERLDNAILQIAGNKPPTELTGDLQVTGQLIANARATFKALANFEQSPEAMALSASVEQLQPGDGASQAISAYPEGVADVFDAAISAVALASDAEIETVNATVREGSGSLPQPEPDPLPEPEPDPLPEPEPDPLPEPEPDPLPEPEPPANNPPVISGTPALQVVAGSFYDFQPDASDADNDDLIFSISNRPEWLSFDTVTGRLSGLPNAGHIGRSENIRISVSDDNATTNLAAFDVVVLEIPNAAPSISGSPITSRVVGQFYNFRPAASDADGDQLTFSISNMPAWASFNTATGRLYGIPGASDIGNSGAVRISVSDTKVVTSLPEFSITVSAVANSAPVISGTPSVLITAGQFYSFQPTASDADGDQLSFSINNRPTWASFNTATGRLSGTPDSADAGTWSGVRIEVTDGVASASLGSFTIQVQSLSGPSSDVELAWVAPVANVDGTALTDLTGFKLYFGRQGGSLTESRDINNANATSYLVQGLESGVWRFVLTAVNASGQESRFSDEATFSVN